jgi:hypoxanthine phosphoribosyltransferase
MATSWQRSPSKQKEDITWERVYELCQAIECQLYITHPNIQVIAGVYKGGMIPASIIAYMHKCDVITVELPEELAKYKQENVLLIDDVCDTGETFKKFKHLTEMTKACLVVKPWADPMPDIVAHWSQNWVVFPWEK